MVYLRKDIKFLYVLLIPVILIIGNQALQNKHTHYYSNQIIVHSHPLEKSNDDPVANHNHSKAEIIFYNIVGFDYYSQSGEQYYETGIDSTPCIYLSAAEKSPYVVWLCNTDSRDPPPEIIKLMI